MKKRLTAERRNEIAQLLVRDGNIKASELAKKFAVSTETIRKDLIYLENQGIAQKSYGGAVAATELVERPVALKELEYMDVKTAIASKALEMIPEKGVVLLDAGSTNYALAKQLTLRKDLTIFTNSILALNVLSDSENEVFALGGRVRGSSKGIVGAWAMQALQSIHIDVAFLGTDGLKDMNGPSTASYEECELKQAVLACCNQFVVLSDHTKFESTGLFQYCSWEEVDAVITNETVNEETRREIEKIKEQTDVILV